MLTNNQEIGHNTGKYALWTTPPESLHEHLGVWISTQTSTLTPTSGYKIRVHAIHVSILCTLAFTATGCSTITFGTGHLSDSSKVLWSGRIQNKGDHQNEFLSNLNVVGAVDEVITLTHMTYSGGSGEIRAVIYYTEE